MLRMIPFDVGMGVPLAARAHVKLHEPHAALDQPPGQQAIAAVDARFLLVQAVELMRLGRFARQIDGLGRGGLHAIGQFVGGDAGFEVGVFRSLGAMPGVQLLDEIDFRPLPIGRPTARRGDVQDRRFAVAELRALDSWRA